MTTIETNTVTNSATDTVKPTKAKASQVASETVAVTAPALLHVTKTTKVNLVHLQAKISAIVARAGVSHKDAASDANQALLARISKTAIRHDGNGEIAGAIGRVKVNAMKEAGIINKEQHAEQIRLINFLDAASKLIAG